MFTPVDHLRLTLKPVPAPPLCSLVNYRRGRTSSLESGRTGRCRPEDVQTPTKQNNLGVKEEGVWEGGGE